MEIKIRNAASTTVTIEDGGALVVLKVAGVAGPLECLAALDALHRALRQSPARAVLIDCKAAALTLSQADYVDLLRAMLWRPIPHPIAFVAGPWLMHVSSAHEVLVHRRGFSQRFFPETAAALRWIARLRRQPRARDLLGSPAEEER